jgi:hypothetical protein
MCHWLLGPQPIALSIHAPARWQCCLGTPRQNGSACTQPKCLPPPACLVIMSTTVHLALGVYRALATAISMPLPPANSCSLKWVLSQAHGTAEACLVRRCTRKPQAMIRCPPQWTRRPPCTPQSQLCRCRSPCHACNHKCCRHSTRTTR